MNEDDVSRLISDAEEEVDRLIQQNPVIVFSDSTDDICSKAKQVSCGNQAGPCGSLVVDVLLCGEPTPGRGLSCSSCSSLRGCVSGLMTAGN